MPSLLEIVPYDRSRPRHLMAISPELHRLLGDRVVAIDYIGRTSVPGVPAKHLMDVAITFE